MDFFTLFGPLIISISIFSYPAAVYMCFVVFIQRIPEYFLKILHHYPRPFYVTNKIYGLECAIQFGSPSGHSMIGATLWITLCLIMHKELESNANRKLIQWIFYPLILILLVILAYSRIILGMHSIDQVIFGVILGTLLSLFLFQLCFEKFTKEIQKIRQNKRHILVFFIIQLALILSFVIGNAIYEQPEEWVQNIHKNCPNSNPSVFQGAFQITGYCYIWLGAMLGLVVDFKILSNQSIYKWNQIRFCCKGFCIVIISFIFPAALIYVTHITNNFHHLWLQYIIKNACISLLIGFFEIGLVRAIAYSCKLAKKQTQLYAPQHEDEEIEILSNKL